MLRKNKSSRSPLTESTAPAITLDAAHPSILPDRTATASPHLLAPAGPSNWRRWLRPGKGSTGPSDTLAYGNGKDREEPRGLATRKSKDSIRPSVDQNHPPSGVFNLLKKSPSVQPLASFSGESSGIKSSGSRLFGRRSTVTAGSEDPSISPSTNRPPMPCQPVPSAWPGSDFDEEPARRPSGDLVRSGLAGMAKKPWSRSVDDLSRILGMNKSKKPEMHAGALAAGYYADALEVTISSAGTSDLGSPRGTLESTPPTSATSTSPPNQQAFAAPGKPLALRNDQLHENWPQGQGFTMDQVATVQLAFPRSSGPTDVDELYKRRGARRKTHSLSGTALLSNPGEPTAGAGNLPTARSQGMLRGPGKASSPPMLHTSFLALQPGSSLKSSESSPMLNSGTEYRPHQSDRLARLRAEGQPTALRGEAESDNTASTSQVAVHQRSSSQSLLHMGLMPRKHDRKKGSEGSQTVLCGGQGALQSSGSMASLSRPTGKLPSPAATTAHDATRESRLTHAKRASQIIHCSGFLLRHTSTVEQPMRPPPSPGAQQGQPDYFNLTRRVDLQRGWKPYKAVLKGNKVYLFKPPNDKKHAIENLFPQVVRAPSPEPASSIVAPATSERRGNRPKRAFLNTAKHHELQVDTSAGGDAGLSTRVIGGTIAALVHEVIFTTQGKPLVDTETWTAADEEHYRHFVQVVLMAILNQSNSGTFFDNLRTYHDLAVTFCPDKRQYLDLRIEILLDVLSRGFLAVCGVDNQIHEGCSRWLAGLVGAGSPPAILKAVRNLEDKISSRPKLPIGRRASAHILQIIEGSPVEVVARTICAFHQAAMGYLQGNMHAALAEVALGVSGTPSSTSLRAIAYDCNSSGWLTRTILRHILSQDANIPPQGDERNRQRVASLITLWLEVGEACRLLKDTSGFVAVFLALSAPPVKRLTRSWAYLGADKRAVLAGWVELLAPHRSFDKGSVQIGTFVLDQADSLPYCGDLAAFNSGLLGQHIDGERIALACWWPVREAAQPSMEAIMTSKTGSLDVGISEAMLQTIWRENLLSVPGLSPLPASWELSLRIEGPSPYAAWRPRSIMASDQIPAAALQFVSMVAEAGSGWDITSAAPTSGASVRRRNSQPISRRSSAAGSTVSRCTSQLRSRHESSDGLSLAGSSNYSETVELADGELTVRLEMPGSKLSSQPAADAENKSTSASRQSWHADQTMLASNLAQAHRLSIVSKRTSIASSQDLPALSLVITAGSLDRLVDVLLCGLDLTSGASDDHGMLPLKGGGRKFSLALPRFRKTFLSTYRLVCQPIVLLQLLRKRYERAATATTHATGDIGLMSFQWLTEGACVAQVGQPRSRAIADFVQNRVLDVLQAWFAVPGARRDFLDSSETYSVVLSLLTSGDGEESVAKRKLQVLQAFIVLCDSVEHHGDCEVPRGSQLRGFSWRIPVDAAGAHILDALNDVGRGLIESLSVEDWIDTASSLAHQNALGWHERDPSTLLRRRQGGVTSLRIDDIYTWCSRDLIGSTNSASSEQSAFWTALPRAVQDSFKAYAVCRQWLEDWLETVSKTAAARSLLEAFEGTLCPQGGAKDCLRLPTFASRVLRAVLCSPVSRHSTGAWMTIVRERGLAMDTSLDELVASAKFAGSPVPTLPDVGYCLEQIVRLLSAGGDALSGIPFDRLTRLFELISAIRPPTAASGCASNPTLEDVLSRYSRESPELGAQHPLARTPGEPLPMFKQGLDAEIAKIDRDYRALCQFMVRQNTSAASLSRRDQQLDRLMMAAPRLESKQPVRTPKRGVSAVIKSLYSWPTTSVQSLALQDSRTAEELDFEPTTKAHLVIALPLAQHHATTQRPYIFTLTTEDGLVHIMQAMTEVSHTHWVTSVNQATAAALEQRRTFLSSAPIAEHIESVQVTPMRRSAHAVFGIDLTALARRHYGDEALDDTAIPPQVEQCFLEVERRGLVEQGVYRVPGSQKLIRQLQDAFDQGLEVDLGPDGDYTDIHIVCGVIKSFFRLMPEPIMPTNMYQQLISAVQLSDTDQRLAAVKDLIWQLPRAHFALLKRLMEHLEQVTDFEDSNQMPPQSLAMCFAPNLLRPPSDQGGFNAALINIGKATKLVKLLITEYHWIFLDNFVHSAPPSPMLLDDESTAQTGRFAPHGG